MNLEQVMIMPTFHQPTLMCGDVKTITDAGFPVALSVDAEHLARFRSEVPLQEWKLVSESRTNLGDRVILLAPEDDLMRTAAYVHPYRPVPDRDRSDMSLHDWNDVDPSVNPGLLAYYINDSMTVVTLPMMCKERVRHNWYRHFFLEINNASPYLQTMSHHNNPGISITDEHRLVIELRAAVAGK